MKVLRAIGSLRAAAAETSLVDMVPALRERDVHLLPVTLSADDDALTQKAVNVGLRAVGSSPTCRRLSSGVKCVSSRRRCRTSACSVTAAMSRTSCAPLTASASRLVWGDSGAL
jgi:hypothetical protein